VFCDTLAYPSMIGPLLLGKKEAQSQRKKKYQSDIYAMGLLIQFIEFELQLVTFSVQYFFPECNN